MRAKAVGLFIHNGRVVNPGDCIDMTEAQYKSVRAHVIPIEEPTRAPAVEKKVVEKPEKAMVKKVVDKKNLKKTNARKR